MRALALASIAAVSLATTANVPSKPDSLERIAVNDNGASAGVLRGGVLTVRLEVRKGDWRPDGDTDPGLDVLAFAEEGGGLQIPGPLIRVKEGTEIHASIRNPLTAGTLIVHGLYTRGAADVQDTMQVAPGMVREVRFTAGKPGTYYYWGSIGDAPPSMLREAEESQLSGAFIIDPRDARTASERNDQIFVIGFWSDSLREQLNPSPAKLRFVINGKSWPHTKRLSYRQGDTVHWRVINTNNQVHPMHLHGFYFRVNSRGNERSDSVYDPRSAPHLAVTERLAPGRTFSMTWVPWRPGNWLFHCHDNLHITPQLPLDDRITPKSSDHQHSDPTLEMMAGLVIGVYVRTSGVAARPEPPARRRLRLVARSDASGTAAEPAYGFVLEEHGSRREGPDLLPGPTILLRRAEPVSIIVVNELAEPTAVHWHGIELESYFDGVAGFAGTPGHIAPAIAPRDSFEARFTPPRAGTFIYHTHVDEVRQQRAGLSGALLVLDEPRSYDPQTDIVLLISTPRGGGDQNVVLINGSKTPPALELRAGARHRLRIINIHTYRPSIRVEIKQAAQTLTWRALAKDGADFPPERATIRPAALQFGNGETYDFELTPTTAGDAVLDVRTGVGVLLASMPIRVR